MQEIASIEPEPERAPTDGEIFDAERPYCLEASVNEAVEDMPWLKKSDKGAIELCRQYARRIDLALAAADYNPFDAGLALGATKALYLGPHLLNALKAIGGTPGDRMDLDIKQAPAKTARQDKEKEEGDSIADFLSANLAKERARRKTDR
jgi:hypothetical protein